MDEATQALRTLAAKDAIRELGMLYSRAVDRKDIALLRSLYTADATDTHGDTFDGPAAGYCDFIERSMPFMPYGGHYVCNHLIATDGDAGEGELYAIACHVVSDGHGGWVEDIRWVRHIDRYRREGDGCWRFAKRVVTYDHRSMRPVDAPPGDVGDGSGDPSYSVVTNRLFARGTRA